jgi:hypothetical protein
MQSDGGLHGISQGTPAPYSAPSTDTEGVTPSLQPSSAPELYGFTATSEPSPGDTLTQSAMLKAPDRPDFLQAQVTEIHTLHEAGVFSYHPIHTLPPKARLLNAIWSYRRNALRPVLSPTTKPAFVQTDHSSSMGWTIGTRTLRSCRGALYVSSSLCLTSIVGILPKSTSLRRSHNRQSKRMYTCISLKGGM